MIELCIGEIIQIEDKHLLEQTVRDYLRRIKRKTAILISASCELGAIASGSGCENGQAFETLWLLRRYVLPNHR